MQSHLIQSKNQSSYKDIQASPTPHPKLSQFPRLITHLVTDAYHTRQAPHSEPFKLKCHFLREAFLTPHLKLQMLQTVLPLPISLPHFIFLLSIYC